MLRTDIVISCVTVCHRKKYITISHEIETKNRTPTYSFADPIYSRAYLWWQKIRWLYGMHDELLSLSPIYDLRLPIDVAFINHIIVQHQIFSLLCCFYYFIFIFTLHCVACSLAPIGNVILAQCPPCNLAHLARPGLAPFEGTPKINKLWFRKCNVRAHTITITIYYYYKRNGITSQAINVWS